jgi:hypothetical protein
MSEAASAVNVRSLDFLRVVLAGLSGDLVVQAGPGLQNLPPDVKGWRELQALPGPITVSIPYRVRDDSVVRIDLLTNTNDGEAAR